MSKTALTNFENYEEILSYIASGRSDELSIEKQDILKRWRAGAAILRQYPQKMQAARRLKAAFPVISIRQAQLDIDNACKLWNLDNKYDLDFLKSWLIIKLFDEIGSKNSTEVSRAKNLATLARFIENSPDVRIDPKLIEKNTINIQFNLNGNMLSLSQEVINKLPEVLKSQILSAVPNEVTEDQACEIMES